MKTKHITSVVFFIIQLFLFSCLSGRKASVINVLNESKTLTTEEKNRGIVTEQKKNAALQEERIDSSILNLIQKKLTGNQTYLDSAVNNIAVLDTILGDRKLFRKNYKTTVAQNVAWLVQYNTTSPTRVLKQQMIQNSIERTDKKIYNLAAYFGPGKYLIPEEEYTNASTAFLPLIDSVLSYVSGFDSLKSTATVVVVGFSDGQAVPPQSDLYKELTTYLKKDTASKEELNTALSDFRAIEIGRLVYSLFKKKNEVSNSKERLNFNSYGYGLGETHPSKLITDYMEADERRRIVLVYWIVLPD
jgi:hypothetical protein